MALTDQQQDFISKLMAWSELELKQRDVARNLVARWSKNDVLAKLDNASIQAVFAHLDVNKVNAAVSALKAVTTALGDDESGQAVSLIVLA